MSTEDHNEAGTHADDRWAVLTGQVDHPTRAPLAEPELRARRESAFLVLVALSIAATTALIAFGATRIVDLGYVIASVAPDVELPVRAWLPLGVLALPLVWFAGNLVSELYGGHRAAVLARVGLLAGIAVAGLVRVADNLADADALLGPALALVACYLVAHVVNRRVFDAMRRRAGSRGRWLRAVVAPVLALILGWIAFAFALYAYDVYALGAADRDASTRAVALAAGSAAYTAACALVGVVPFVIAARALAAYLRIAPELPDTDGSYRDGPSFVRGAARTDPVLLTRRTAPGSPSTYSSGEMRFFAEGDELGSAASDRSP